MRRQLYSTCVNAFAALMHDSLVQGRLLFAQAAEENLASLKQQLAAAKVDHKEFRPDLFDWGSLANGIAM